MLEADEETAQCNGLAALDLAFDIDADFSYQARDGLGAAIASSKGWGKQGQALANSIGQECKLPSLTREAEATFTLRGVQLKIPRGEYGLNISFKSLADWMQVPLCAL